MLNEYQRYTPTELQELPSIYSLDIYHLPFREIAHEDLKKEGLDLLPREDDIIFLCDTKIEDSIVGVIMDARIIRIDNEEGLSGISCIVSRDEAEIEMYVGFIQIDGEIFTDPSILRTDPKGLLPKGLGLDIFSTMTQLYQDHANAVGIPVVDQCERDTHISATPMSHKKWNQLFEPLLQEYGYTRITDGEWRKTYMPEKSAD